MGFDLSIRAWAVVPIDKEFDDGLCYTSAPEILGCGTIYQIYTTEADAIAFCEEVKFVNVEYRVMAVDIDVARKS